MIRHMFLLVFAMGAVGLSAQTRTPEQQQWVAMLQGNALAGRGAAKPGFALYYATSGEVKQPYLVYVPKRYDGHKKTPLVVFLHGAVLALDSFQYFRPELAREPVFAAAEKDGVLALFPLARHRARAEAGAGAGRQCQLLVYGESSGNVCGFLCIFVAAIGYGP